MDALRGVAGSLAGILSLLLFPVVMCGALLYIAVRGLAGLALEVGARLGGDGHPTGWRAQHR